MTLNIFDGSFAFQRTLIDTDSFKGVERDNAPANDRNQFKVSERSEAHAAERSKKSDDDFAAFLKSSQEESKARKNDESRKADDTESSNAVNERAQSAETKDNGDVRDAFATQETSVSIVAPENLVLPEGYEDVDATALLANLSQELRAFIDELVSRTEDEGQKIVTDVITSNGEAAPDVKGLLGLLVNLAGKNDDQPFAQGQEVTLSDVIQAVQDLTQDDNLAVLTSNLTPEEVTALQEKLAAHSQEEIIPADEDALMALAAQIVSLVEPSGDAKKTQDSQNNVSDAKMQALTAAATLPTPAQQAASATIQTQPPAPSRFDGRYDAAAQSGQASPVSADAVAADNTARVHNANAAQAQTPNNAGVASPTAGEKFLQLLQTSTGALPLADGSMPSQQAAGQALQSLPSSQSSLTNVITQSSSAVQAHPATQLVSATIQKAVKAGEDTNIKLRLDPPELGRVEVKMSIDGDNTAKIVLTIEKPETFLMMQRDADALQRAMTESGLDMDGDLSFELASEDHDFEQPQKQGRSDRGVSDEAELIEETTLDVQIDPITGHVRTDILV